MAEKKVTKKTEQPAQPKVDLLDVLLDKDNKDPIVLMDEKGKQISFEQVAIIPYEVKKDERVLYVVLKPIDKIEGIADDEAVVFLVDQDKAGNTVLRVEEDEEVAIAVFDKYYDLLEEARGKTKKTATKTPAKTAAKAAPKTAAKTTTKAAPATKAKTTTKVAAKVPAKTATKTAGKAAGKKTK